MGMMDVLNSSSNLKDSEGVDCRNYGVLDGVKEAKELLGAMSEVSPDKIIIYGQLQPERDVRHCGQIHDPWRYGQHALVQLDKVKFLCPVPATTATLRLPNNFGIEMINVPIDAHRPGYGYGGGAGKLGSGHQGYLVRAEVFQSPGESPTLTRRCAVSRGSNPPRKTSASTGTTPTACIIFMTTIRIS